MPESLLDLHRAGRIPREYPRVRGLLADLADPELPAAGRLLARVRPEDVLREHPGTSTVRVAITGHGTLTELVPMLTAEMARHGLLLRHTLSEFGSQVHDLSTPDSPLHAGRPELVLSVLTPMMVVDLLPTPWRPEDLAAALEHTVDLLEGLAARFSAISDATLVLNTLPLPRQIAAQVLDHRSRARLGARWREGNARLLRLVDACPGLVVFDLDQLAEGTEVRDSRMSTYAKAHLAPELLGRYARQAAHLARHITGRTKKCLVLDLDGTLWGGILGEDGVDGIEVAASPRGEAFHTFQRLVRQLGSQGVLIAVVSKNDEETVREAFRSHPAMVLREKDFVRLVVNWKPKPDNIAALADDLGIATDSVVFVDDSATECGQVRARLPEVAVVAVDTEPAWHGEKLLRDGWFDVGDLTDEDRARHTRYRDEAARRDLRKTVESFEDYLADLEISVGLGTLVDAPEFARVSQLTLRTNQFNMTTRRLQQAELRDLVTQPGVRVFTVYSADRFGDNGLVGAVFTRRIGDTVTIENFVLSCRVFTRRIEHAVLSEILRQARAAGATSVLAEYRPSKKNGKFRDFYPDNGFEPSPGQGPDPVFQHALTSIPAPPGHIELTTHGEGGVR